MVRLAAVTLVTSATHLGGYEAAPLAIGLFVSVSILVALCAKHARRVTKSLRNETGNSSSSKVAPRSPLASSKQLLATISNKAIAFAQKKGLAGQQSEASGFHEGKFYDDDDDDDERGGFGDGGLWQRAILMGEKCQPPDFSGVIYYDSNGKQLPELPPRSPRATPLHTMLK